LVKLNKIYTRTGDKGTTGLVDGSRVDKHAARMEAIGSVDEANSALGLAVVAVDGAHRDALLRIQNDLFDLGADLATPGKISRRDRWCCALSGHRSTGWKARSMQ
jgi:cob(I)alamin adenosyltransferase